LLAVAVVVVLAAILIGLAVTVIHQDVLAVVMVAAVELDLIIHLEQTPAHILVLVLVALVDITVALKFLVKAVEMAVTGALLE
jgi:hypothetical protein